MSDEASDAERARLRACVIAAAERGLRSPSNKKRNPEYRKPSEADKAWTHAYGTARALADWATAEHIALAIEGRASRTDDQSKNADAIRRCRDILNTLLDGLESAS